MKKMKPATRSLVIALCVLVVLAVAAAVLLLPGISQGGAAQSSDPTASGSALTLVEHTDRDLKSLTVPNEEDSYTVTTYMDGGRLLYNVEDMGDASVDSDAVKEVAQHALALEATSDVGAVGEVRDLSEYGLDKPSATFKAEYNDGSTLELQVGNAANGGGYYVLLNDHVYIAEIDPSAFVNRYAFLDATLFAIGIVGNGSDVVDYFSLSGRKYEREISLRYTGNDKNGPYNGLFMPYIVTEPYYSGVNSNRIDEIVQTLSAVQTVGTISYDPDKEMLTEMGLDDPYVRCEFSIKDHPHVLLLGDKYNDDYRYLMADDDPVVYLVSEDALASILAMTELSVRDGFVWSPMIRKVSSVTVSTGNDKKVFELTRAEDTSSTTSSGVNYNYTLTIDGKAADYDEFRTLYTTMIAPMVMSTDECKVQDKPALTLTFTYYAGGDDTVEYYLVEDADRRYAAYVNGEYSGLVKESSVTDILEGTFG